MVKRKTAKGKTLKKISIKDIKFFKIANRQGYGAIAKNNLTEGNTPYQAYSRLVKACRRCGYELPARKATQLPKIK